jgi:hypothetical protein
MPGTRQEIEMTIEEMLKEAESLDMLGPATSSGIVARSLAQLWRELAKLKEELGG